MSRTAVPPRPWTRAARAGFLLASLVGITLISSHLFGLRPALDTVLGARTGADDAPLLVNADHALPDDYQPDLVALVGEVPVSHSEVKVATELRKPLRTMFAAAREAGVTRLYVASGYRTADEQQELWDEATDRSYVQPPGHSEHQTGLAVDLADTKVGANSFGESKAGKWLAKNSWKYGFLLRYPTGKEDITGISYEPWHFRYVGKPVAAACKEQNLTLEEYLASGLGAKGKA